MADKQELRGSYMRNSFFFLLLLTSGLGLVVCPHQIKENSTDFMFRDVLVNATDNSLVTDGNCSIKVTDADSGSIITNWASMSNEGDGNYNYTFSGNEVLSGSYYFQENCTKENYTALSSNYCYTVYGETVKETVDTVNSTVTTIKATTDSTYTLLGTVNTAISSIKVTVEAVYTALVNGDWAKQVWDNNVVAQTNRVTKGDTIDPGAGGKTRERVLPTK